MDFATKIFSRGPTFVGVAVMGCHHQHTAEVCPELVAGFLRYGPVGT